MINCSVVFRTPLVKNMFENQMIIILYVKFTRKYLFVLKIRIYLHV